MQQNISPFLTQMLATYVMRNTGFVTTKVGHHQRERQLDEQQQGRSLKKNPSCVAGVEIVAYVKRVKDLEGVVDPNTGHPGS